MTYHLPIDPDAKPMSEEDRASRCSCGAPGIYKLNALDALCPACWKASLEKRAAVSWTSPVYDYATGRWTAGTVTHCPEEL